MKTQTETLTARLTERLLIMIATNAYATGNTVVVYANHEPGNIMQNIVHGTRENGPMTPVFLPMTKAEWEASDAPSIFAFAEMKWKEEGQFKKPWDF